MSWLSPRPRFPSRASLMYAFSRCAVCSCGGRRLALCTWPRGQDDYYTRDVSERPRAFRNVITHATLRRVSRGRPDLAGCLPRCVRTDGRVKLCEKIVPTLAEPHFRAVWVLQEGHSQQTFGQWRRHQSDGQSGLSSTAPGHMSATQRSPM